MSFILDGQGARDVVGAPLQRLDQPCLESETGDSPGSLHVAFAPPKSHTRYQIKPKVDHLLASAALLKMAIYPISLIDLHAEQPNGYITLGSLTISRP